MRFISLASFALILVINPLFSLDPNAEHSDGVTMRLNAEINDSQLFFINNKNTSGNLADNTNVISLIFFDCTDQFFSDFKWSEYPKTKSVMMNNATINSSSIQGLLSLKDLRVIEIDRCKYDDEQLIRVVETLELAQLRLSNLKPSEMLLKKIANKTSIQILDLNHSEINDADLQFVHNSQFISSLSVASTNVTESCLKSVNSLKNLRELHVNKTKITLSKLSKIKLNENVTTLGIDISQIEENPDFFQNNKNVRILVITTSDIKSNKLTWLRKNFSSVKIIVIEEKPLLPYPIVEPPSA